MSVIWNTTRRWDWKNCRPSHYLPCVQVTVRVDCKTQSSYLHREIIPNRNRKVAHGFVDTCAQTTATSVELLEMFHISSKKVIPTNRRIFTANDSEMGLLSAVFICVEYNGHQASQLCYYYLSNLNDFVFVLKYAFNFASSLHHFHTRLRV